MDMTIYKTLRLRERTLYLFERIGFGPLTQEHCLYFIPFMSVDTTYPLLKKGRNMFLLFFFSFLLKMFYLLNCDDEIYLPLFDNDFCKFVQKLILITRFAIFFKVNA